MLNQCEDFYDPPVGRTDLVVKDEWRWHKSPVLNMRDMKDYNFMGIYVIWLATFSKERVKQNTCFGGDLWK